MVPRRQLTARERKSLLVKTAQGMRRYSLILWVVALGLSCLQGCGVGAPKWRNTVSPVSSSAPVLPESGADPLVGGTTEPLQLNVQSPIGEANLMLWSRANGGILLGGSEGITIVRDSDDQPQIQSLDINVQTSSFGELTLLAEAEQANTVAFSTVEDTIIVLNLEDNRSPEYQQTSDQPITGLAVSADGRLVGYSGYRGRITILPAGDAPTAQAVKSWDFPVWLSDLSFSPDAKYLGGVDLASFTVYLMDTDTGRVARVLEWTDSTSAVLYSVAFSSDWQKAAWIAQTSVMIMDVRDGRQGPTLNHSDHISAYAWSPNGGMFATGSAISYGDEMRPAVLVWDPYSGKLLATLPQPAAVEKLAFSPENDRLAVLHPGGSLQVWDLKFSK